MDKDTQTLKLTDNFTKEEFACRCGCGLKSIDEGLVHRLQVCRDIIGESIEVLSGCRCQKHNEVVGGELKSYHLKGDAADWTLKDKEKLRRFGEYMTDKWSGGWHYYPTQGFIHSDIGPKRRW